MLIVGLAPAAHGGNRTGRVFTGDRSGDWLFAALHRAGYANQPTSVRVDDGLVLRDAYIAAAVRCAPPPNKPTTTERDRACPSSTRELALLDDVRVIVVLGKFAYDVVAGAASVPPRDPVRPRRRGSVADGRVRRCARSTRSQQNTFTGKLTEPMFDAIFSRARQLSR